MKTYLTFLLTLFFFLPALTALADQKLSAELELARSPVDGKVIRITVPEASRAAAMLQTPQQHPGEMAMQFLKSHGKHLGLLDPEKELIPHGVLVDELGMSHVVYGQSYQGLPVFGSEIRVHLDQQKRVSSAAGKALSGLRFTTRPKITPQQAEQVARDDYMERHDTARPNLESEPRLLVVDLALITPKKQAVPRLAWEVQLASSRPIVDENFYIDAQNGKLLISIPNTRWQSAPPGTFRRIYDCSVFEEPPLDSACYVGVTIDAYPNRKFGRRENEPPVGPNPLRWGALDVDYAHTWIGQAHNWLWHTFQRHGANKRGGLGDGSSYTSPLDATHVFMHKEKVRWVECNPPAGFYLRQIDFCTGYGTIDTLAHEYGHGIGFFRWPTEGTVNDSKNSLVYQWNSGSLDENMADIVAEGVEYYIKGENDWLIGTDTPRGPIRSMQDPPSYGGVKRHPDRHSHYLFECSSYDLHGVHVNAGVMNKAAHLLAMGGDFNGCRIEALGRDKMAKIFYRAVTYYYSASENFNDAYFSLRQACFDLYGLDSSECLQLKYALQAVELDQSSRCDGNLGLKPACTIPEVDQCPGSASKSQPGSCGCYHPDIDQDRDGFTSCDTDPKLRDCDDEDPTVYPGAPELPDQKDNDCDGMIDEDTHPNGDQDGDGYTSVFANYGSRDDCDDSHPLIYPGAFEVCNMRDDNCNGRIDERLAPKARCGVEHDDGGYTEGELVCEFFPGEDPDDSELMACSTLGRDEVCDGYDNNYDGWVDEGFNVGAACTVGVGACQASGTYICDGLYSTKCNAVPGNPSNEVCDGIDNNCNGVVDEGFNIGEPCTVGVGGCKRDGVMVCADALTTKCSVTPGEPEAEYCDGIDNDCDGIIDNGFDIGEPCTVGVGACQRDGQLICNGPTATKCDGVPGEPSPEICDNIDNNCNGQVDEDLTRDCGETDIGLCRYGTETCSAGSWGECQDAVYPQSEICDGLDNDCDGVVDNDCPKVVAMHIFYNRSAFDKNSAAANADDDLAIATDKTPLLSGQRALFPNYTSYSRGINGIMIDIENLPAGAELTTADFQFLRGNSSDSAAWATAPGPSAITVRRAAGVGESARITLIWPDNQIQKTWLKVTVLPTASSGLYQAKSFYYGNAIGEVGNFTTNAIVNSADQLLIRQNVSGLTPVPVTSRYDIDRNRLVNSTDVLQARQNVSGTDPLVLITAP